MLANIVCFQPHIRINLYSTREIANVSTITDALLKLDMKSAIRDVRRFNYVCKVTLLTFPSIFQLVRRLLADRLHTLTGRSQLYIIELLKVIMHQGEVVLSTPYTFQCQEVAIRPLSFDNCLTLCGQIWSVTSMITLEVRSCGPITGSLSLR